MKIICWIKHTFSCFFLVKTKIYTCYPCAASSELQSGTLTTAGPSSRAGFKAILLRISSFYSNDNDAHWDVFLQKLKRVASTDLWYYST